MAIKSITIENFKCIGDAVTIPIRPITLLFGKNSSGKSTVLHALRYWFAIRDGFLVQETKQSMQNTIEIKQNTIEMSGGYTIDLKDFPSLVHRHELDRKIRIRITYDRNTMDTQNENHLLWSEVVTNGEASSTKVESVLSVFVRNGKEMCFVSGELSDDVVVDSNGKKLIPKRLDDFRWGLALAFGLAFPPLGLFGLIFGRFLKKILQEPKEFDAIRRSDAIRHLGPFRELPPRHYYKPKISDEGRYKLRRWEKGLGAWDALSRDSEVLKKTNHYMQHVLKLGYSINRRKHDSTDQKQWPRLHDEKNNIDIHPSDVGVGIAQVIPVVVGALDDIQSHEVFAVEQPELHVHPAVQVALGDVFIDGMKNSNRIMLIETHSEHLLLRLLRRVRETSRTNVDTEYKLVSNDLSVLYVQSTPKGVTYTPLSVTDDGDFNEPWPEGFFEERMEELF